MLSVTVILKMTGFELLQSVHDVEKRKRATDAVQVVVSVWSDVSGADKKDAGKVAGCVLVMESPLAGLDIHDIDFDRCRGDPRDIN